MNPRRSFASGAGLFILLGFAALAYLATQTTSIANVRHGDTYAVHAQFNNVGQLKDRAPVKVAGVRIGEVESIGLDADSDVADVTLSIDSTYHEIPQNSVATIHTSGLLGDQYVGVDYGDAEDTLQPGDKLALTRSSQSLEAMLAGFLGTGGASDRIGGTYQLHASFRNVGTLTAGSPVKLSGVAIGHVTSVKADPKKLNAVVKLAIDKRYDDIPEDSSASVFTSGLLGGQYIGIEPGGSPQALEDGDGFVLTQSALQLEDLIGKFMTGGSDDDSGN